jgi:hypothetical protein
MCVVTNQNQRRDGRLQNSCRHASLGKPERLLRAFEPLMSHLQVVVKPGLHRQQETVKTVKNGKKGKNG